MPDAAPLRIVFAGTPAFAAVSLAALLASAHGGEAGGGGRGSEAGEADGGDEAVGGRQAGKAGGGEAKRPAGHEVVGVFTQPDRGSGRGRKLTASAVKTLALEHGLPVQQPTSLRDASALAALAALRPDVLVVVAYGSILPPEVLAIPPLGCLNVHGSLLPRWRGAAPVQRAILAGDAETGVCIMQMDEGLDTGDVLARASTPIGADETASELTDRLAALGAATLVPAIEARRAGAATAEPQPDVGVTYAAKLDKAEARLDFTESADLLHRRVRAYHGWPVAESTLAGERVRLWRTRLVRAPLPNGQSVHAATAARPAGADAAPGTILDVSGDAIRVATGDGVLELLELQRPGGRPLDAGTFAHDRELVGHQFAG